MYYPVFDRVLKKKVPQAALGAVCGTFIYFTVARYAVPCLIRSSKRKPGLRFATVGPLLWVLLS